MSFQQSSPAVLIAKEEGLRHDCVHLYWVSIVSDFILTGAGVLLLCRKNKASALFHKPLASRTSVHQWFLVYRFFGQPKCNPCFQTVKMFSSSYDQCWSFQACFFRKNKNNSKGIFLPVLFFPLLLLAMGGSLFCQNDHTPRMTKLLSTLRRQKTAETKPQPIWTAVFTDVTCQVQ